jgi:peptide/nickel transport system ATP-binding protein
MYGGRKVEEITPSKVKTPQHPYSQLLFSSVPKLDPAWLDGLRQDPELVRAYCRH